MEINAMFFTSSAAPLTPEGGTVTEKHTGVRGAIVPPSGVRGILRRKYRNKRPEKLIIS